ncbi:MAG: hypothetical protein ACF8PG_14435 [Maioricimonas sp. JB045]
MTCPRRAVWSVYDATGRLERQENSVISRPIRSSEFVLCRETQAFPATRQKGIDATVPHLHCTGHSSGQSRIPGLSRWVLNQRGDSGHAVRLFKGECDDGFAARIVP